MLEDTRLAIAPLKPQLEQDFLCQVSLVLFNQELEMETMWEYVPALHREVVDIQQTQ